MRIAAAAAPPLSTCVSCAPWNPSRHSGSPRQAEDPESLCRPAPRQVDGSLCLAPGGHIDHVAGGEQGKGLERGAVLAAQGQVQILGHPAADVGHLQGEGKGVPWGQRIRISAVGLQDDPRFGQAGRRGLGDLQPDGLLVGIALALVVGVARARGA